MQQDLSRLTNELRKESCPQRVLDEVAQKISTERSAPARWRLAIRFGIAGLALLCCLSVWLWQAGKNARQQAELARTVEQARIASQAKDALDFMGSVIANAAVDSGKIISQQAVPPLRDSLHTAKTKILEPIEL